GAATAMSTNGALRAIPTAVTPHSRSERTRATQAETNPKMRKTPSAITPTFSPDIGWPPRRRPAKSAQAMPTNGASTEATFQQGRGRWSMSAAPLRLGPQSLRHGHDVLKNHGQDAERAGFPALSPSHSSVEQARSSRFFRSSELANVPLPLRPAQ